MTSEPVFSERETQKLVRGNNRDDALMISNCLSTFLSDLSDEDKHSLVDYDDALEATGEREETSFGRTFA